MDDQGLIFLQIMIAVAVVGVLSFLIYLVAQYGRRSRTVGAGEAAPPQTPQWYEYLLAAIVLVVVAAVLLWQFFPTIAGSGDGWRGDTRGIVFFAVMAAVGVLAFLAFIVTALVRTSRQQRVGPTGALAETAGTDTAAGAEAEPQRSGVGARVLGLLAIVLAVLLLNWIYVPRDLQYDLMLYAIYPAGFALTLVLLFDKATRRWSTKGPAESLREWLFCDGFAFFLVLGFLNLRQWQQADAYSGLFWDVLAIGLLLTAFWLIDRGAARFRFLLGYGLMIVLPILLFVWRFVLGVEAPEDLSWWSTIWPFLILAVVFFVLEVVSVLASGDSDRQVIPALKDVLYFILLAVLLIVAIPSAPE